MPMPASGALSMSQANVEMGRAAGAAINFNDVELRILANNYAAAGTVLSMSGLHGKSWRWVYTQTTAFNGQMNVRNHSITNGWDYQRPIDFYIASGVTVNASGTGATGEAVRIGGTFPRGVRFFNAGSIGGRGGGAAWGAGLYAGSDGVNCTDAFGDPVTGTAVQGGPGLRAYVACTIHNTGSIRGGGGSGRGGNPAGARMNNAWSGNGGGGGGGGRSNFGYNSLAGIGGGVSGTGGARRNGSTGGVGTSSAAGAGGAQHTANTVHTVTSGNDSIWASTRGGSGGGGGGWGAAGGASGGTLRASTSGSSGRQLCTGGFSAGAGGSAGLSVRGNNFITWTSFGTRTGPISS